MVAAVGRPTQNEHMESFNDRLREECFEERGICSFAA